MEMAVINRSYLDNYELIVMQKTLYCWKAQDAARSSETIVKNNRSTVVALPTIVHSSGDTLVRWGHAHFRLGNGALPRLSRGINIHLSEGVGAPCDSKGKRTGTR